MQNHPVCEAGKCCEVIRGKCLRITKQSQYHKKKSGSFASVSCSFIKASLRSFQMLHFSPGIRWLHHRGDNRRQHYLCFRQYHASPWAFTGEFPLQWPWPVHIFIFSWGSIQISDEKWCRYREAVSEKEVHGELKRVQLLQNQTRPKILGQVKGRRRRVSA